MQRFKNILMLHTQRVGDENTLERAAELARRNSARLTVAEVHQDLPERPTPLLRERHAHLARLTDSIRSSGVDVATLVLQGRPFLELVRAVIKDGYDLVLLTADEAHGIRAMAFGTTSMHLMRKCPCPVWVMKPAAPRRFRRVLAAVDLDGGSGASPLDLKIIQLASSLSRIEGCVLDVLHAWDFRGTDRDTARSEITEEIRAELFERNRRCRRAALDELLDQIDLDGLRWQVHLPHGIPSVAIPRFVQDADVDLIVMGTVTRGSIAGFLIGETAEDVLRQVDCSVLTAKPDDFITPITLQG